MTPFSSVVPGTTSSMKPFAPGKPKRVLSADVYDTIEFVAHVHGGIGAGSWYSGYAPVCLVGCAEFAGIMASHLDLASDYGLPFEHENDAAVKAINRRRRRHANTRVPFELLCQELGIVRGEAA